MPIIVTKKGCRLSGTPEELVQMLYDRTGPFIRASMSREEWMRWTVQLITEKDGASVTFPASDLDWLLLCARYSFWYFEEF